MHNIPGYPTCVIFLKKKTTPEYQIWYSCHSFHLMIIIRWSSKSRKAERTKYISNDKKQRIQLNQIRCSTHSCHVMINQHANLLCGVARTKIRWFQIILLTLVRSNWSRSQGVLAPRGNVNEEFGENYFTLMCHYLAPMFHTCEVFSVTRRSRSDSGYSNWVTYSLTQC